MTCDFLYLMLFVCNCTLIYCISSFFAQLPLCSIFDRNYQQSFRIADFLTNVQLLLEEPEAMDPIDRCVVPPR